MKDRSGCFYPIKIWSKIGNEKDIIQMFIKYSYYEESEYRVLISQSKNLSGHLVELGSPSVNWFKIEKGIQDEKTIKAAIQS